MQNMSAQWNQQPIDLMLSKLIKFLEQTFENKSITRDHRIQNKWTEYKIFELKSGNRKLSNVWKYNPGKVSSCKFCFY